MCHLDGDAPADEYQTQASLQAGTLSPTSAVAIGGLGASSASSPAAPASQGRLVIEDFPLEFDGYVYKHGKIAYVEGRGPAPVVLVHPNYAGCKQFDVDQAAFLARAGYVGVAVDIYKETPDYTYGDRNPDRKVAAAGTPEGKKHYQGAFTKMQGLLMQPKTWRALMAATLEKARRHPAAHKEYAAAIGYCLGGQACLEQVRAGHSLQAVVTFHGLLQSYPFENFLRSGHRRMTQQEYEAKVDVGPNNYNKQCKVLIENGDLDDHVSQENLDLWKKEMDEQGIDWRFNNHARTPHGFALAPGVWSTSYVEDVDRRSTLTMLSLFAEVWPEFPQYEVECNAAGTRLGQSILVARPGSAKL